MRAPANRMPALHAYYGVGLYKSTDGGANWQVLAADTFGGRAFSRIVINPTNTQILFASIVHPGLGYPGGDRGHERAPRIDGPGRCISIFGWRRLLDASCGWTSRCGCVRHRHGARQSEHALRRDRCRARRSGQRRLQEHRRRRHLDETRRRVPRQHSPHRARRRAEQRAADLRVHRGPRQRHVEHRIGDDRRLQDGRRRRHLGEYQRRHLPRQPRQLRQLRGRR